MELRIQRKSSNPLYTVGIFYVNNLEITHTVESTVSMLPAGNYQIRLTRDKSRRRVIGIFAHKDEQSKTRDAQPSQPSQPSIPQLSTLNTQPSTFNPQRSTLNLKYTGWSIGTGHSWIGSRKHLVIAIGDILIPGILFNATETYERLFDRIEKCEQRAEPITLTILDNQCIRNWPIRHWANVH